MAPNKDYIMFKKIVSIFFLSLIFCNSAFALWPSCRELRADMYDKVLYSHPCAQGQCYQQANQQANKVYNTCRACKSSSNIVAYPNFYTCMSDKIKGYGWEYQYPLSAYPY